MQGNFNGPLLGCDLSSICYIPIDLKQDSLMGWNVLEVESGIAGTRLHPKPLVKSFLTWKTCPKPACEGICYLSYGIELRAGGGQC